MSDDAAAAPQVPRHPFEVALDRPEEVAYWVTRLRRSEADVRDAVAIAGPKLMRVLRALSVLEP